jgi:hypothetical protein
MPHGRRCGPALQPTAVHTCFFTLPHTHHTPTVYAGDAGTAGRQRRKHPSYLPLQILDRPGPHYWSPVHVSSRRLALVPQVQGLLLNARSQFDSYLRDRWASFDETKATCLYYDWKVLLLPLFHPTWSRERHADDRMPKRGRPAPRPLPTQLN